jgi:hypothetical protein
VRTVELHCDKCGSLRTFQQPPCEDGHEADCDEWCCSACGDAMLIGPYTGRLERRRRLAARWRAAMIQRQSVIVRRRAVMVRHRTVLVGHRPGTVRRSRRAA